ncbi:hypothetical protein Tsubulata_022642, partial [Turnera subulata]
YNKTSNQKLLGMSRKILMSEIELAIKEAIYEDGCQSISSPQAAAKQSEDNRGGGGGGGEKVRC